MPDLTGMVALVTGGNSGIGFETFRALVLKGAKVYIASRNEARARNAFCKLENDPDFKGGVYEFLPLDLGSLRSIQDFVHEFQSKEQHLDLLFNNAGVLEPNTNSTKDGYEIHLGVNALGPYYLTKLLLPLILTAKQRHPGKLPRVCFASSIAHHYATKKGFDPRNPSGEKSMSVFPNFMQAYANSKMMAVLTTLLFDRQYGKDVIFSAVNPGLVKSDISRNITKVSTVFVGQIISSHLLHDTRLGALTQLYANTAPEAGKEGGCYYVPWARIGEPEPIAYDNTVQDTSMYPKTHLQWRTFSMS
ncbi:hypothetical protein MNAN1_000079 [Malassezia nana]|uniref:NAD(P)-binding protein n=1 Tax=Malassezia nana TaxID=180528 RepID=A0AAF0J0L2_9BASI|nr:hypothetical protein MNAN1_000079 [Malassezia nana]